MKTKLFFRTLTVVCICFVANGRAAIEDATFPLPVNLLDNITDPIFKKYCMGRFKEWDTNKDRRISYEEAAAVTRMELSWGDTFGDSYDGSNSHDKMITSLSGIEYFTGLTYLDCSYNQLTSLDLSKNTALTHLDCSYNQLTSLNISKNGALIEMDCSGNELTSLDLSKNSALMELLCYGNELTSLDLSKNVALTELYCRNNKLTSLDLSNNIALTELYCWSNQLTLLDVSKNAALTKLDCTSNKLTSIDISQNSVLEYLSCSNNQLTSLDISNNRELYHLSCSGNPGEGVIFPVRAWFDNRTIPNGNRDYYDKEGNCTSENYNFAKHNSPFNKGVWKYNGTTITIDYQKSRLKSGTSLRGR